MTAQNNVIKKFKKTITKHLIQVNKITNTKIIKITDSK